MTELLFFFEIILMFHPKAYYIPALETQNPAVFVFCVILNITAFVSAKYIISTFKEFCSRKPTR